MQMLVRVCNYDRMNFERLGARAFVLLGGLFWVAAAFGADFGYRDKGVLASATTALLPLGITIGTFVLGWFYERLAAAVLAAAAAVVIVWGVMAAWESGVWWTMTAVLIAPMIVAALLFLLAAQTQMVCALNE